MNTFLASHQSKDKSECTHTRIGSPEHNVYGGSYHIPDVSSFYPAYIKHVFTDGNEEHLTEKQLECGPLGIDLDFRYTEPKRMYTSDHIVDFLDVLLEELHKVFHIHESFSIYIFEKPNINVTPSVIKDGIHIIVCLNLDTQSKTILRNRLLKKMTIWNDLNLTNDWESVLDENVFKGLTAWQLYGSRKPGHEAYKLTSIYTCEHTDNTEYEVRHSPGDSFPIQTEFHKLTIRNTLHKTPELKDEFKTEYDQLKQRKRLRIIHDAPAGEISTPYALNKELDKLFATLNVTEYVIQEAHHYVMCLPQPFYDDYGKWMRVGWALKNTDNRLFISWIKFSSQSAKFNFADIPSLKKLWDSSKSNEEQLTLRSIMYWARTENLVEYEKVKEKSVDMALEEAIREVCTEYDIATILYQLFKDLYICVDIKSGVWFQYTRQKWEETDSGTELRKQITSIHGLYGIFAKKLHQVGQTMNTMTPDDERFAAIKKKHTKISGIMTNMLKKSGEKIMRECCHIFYTKDFIDLLDSKNYLLCFTNGVVDFSTNTFRDGLPEDYTHKCTKIPYVPLHDVNSTVIEEVKTFMAQLFPDEELRNYMWDHSASVLIGRNSSQTFNIYIGGGRNGKSKFVELMSAVLGDYKATLPISLVTKQRVGVGSVSPEIANLKGIRYAVMQESSVHDKINEGVMKELTGGDSLQCRALYKGPISFIPQFKLVMATNNLPGMDGKDEGTWRRIRTVEFKSEFKETPTNSKYQFKVDKNLDEKFDSWKIAFMSLLVDRAFQTKGNVVDCKMVTSHSEKYRNDQDYLSSFTKDCIHINPVGILTEKAIYEKFTEWWKLLHGKNVPKGKELFGYMDRVYINESAVSKKGTVWFGLQVLQEEEVIDLV
jgi:P4 family phage/plasmid primase-like protien